MRLTRADCGISGVLHHLYADKHLYSAAARPTLARHKATIAFAAEQASAQHSQPPNTEEDDAVAPGMQSEGNGPDPQRAP